MNISKIHGSVIGLIGCIISIMYMKKAAHVVETLMDSCYRVIDSGLNEEQMTRAHYE